MAALETLALTKLATVSGVNMQTAGSTTLYTVPAGRTFIPVMVVIRNTSASLAGGTSYSFTNFRSGVDLSGMTTPSTSYRAILATDNTSFTVCAAGTAFQITVTTGSTAAATATIDVWGYLV